MLLGSVSVTSHAVEAVKTDSVFSYHSLKQVQKVFQNMFVIWEFNLGRDYFVKFLQAK